MTLDAHDPSLHPVDCPECQRMTKDEPSNTGIMMEHYRSADAKGAKAKFDVTERAKPVRQTERGSRIMGRYDDQFDEVNERIDRLVDVVGSVRDMFHTERHHHQRETARLTDEDLRRRASLRRAEQNRARELLNPRIVRISYVNEHRILLDQEWDYIDGIGNLRVGDRVVTPRFQYPDCEGVVVAVDEPKMWDGRLKTIRERV